MAEQMVKADLNVPDRLSIEKDSPYYNAAFMNVEVIIDGKLRRGDVVEYCVSESWARVWIRNSRGEFTKERGRARTIRIHGKIEPFIRAKT
jgi:hypothetical protein